MLGSVVLLAASACGGSGSGSDVDGGTDAEPGADADSGTDTGGETSADAEGDDGTDGDATLCDGVRARVEAYKAAHPGNGGKDWDINTLTPAEVAADPDAGYLLSFCGADQRPIFPLLAWEYGGADHPWINPDASALVYCVYTPVNPSSSNWEYDTAADHVTADVYIKCPEQNPCNDRTGANQVSDCIGAASNFEILVDTASLHDGADAGLSLAEASTELRLILADGTKVHLYTGL